MLPALIILTVIGLGVGAFFAYQAQERRRADALAEIIDDPAMDRVHIEVRSVPIGHRTTHDRDHEPYTYARATLGGTLQALTVGRSDPQDGTHPTKLTHDQYFGALWVSGTDTALSAPQQQALWLFFGNEDRDRGVADGQIWARAHGRLDAMGQVALQSDVADLLAVLDG